MTRYNFLKRINILIIALAVALSAGGAGLTAHKIYEDKAIYATSRYGSRGDEVRKIQKSSPSLDITGAVWTEFTDRTRRARSRAFSEA